MKVFDRSHPVML